MTFNQRRAACPLTDVEIIMADMSTLGDTLTDCLFQAVVAENFLTKERFPLPPKHRLPGAPPDSYDLLRYGAECVVEARKQINALIDASNGEIYY